MKIASYNLENLFLRPVAMNGKTLADGKDALKAHADINAILAKPTYGAADKKRIVDLLKKLKLEKSDDGGPFALLRQNRGDLIKRPKNKPIEVVANGRADWIGWVELKREEVDEVATRNTARVINEIDADILGLVEAESRPALVRFSQNVIGAALGGTPYAHAMLIDGNDDRGIDVGLYTRQGFDIASMCSHVDDVDPKGRVFSRDCAQYEIRTPSGKLVHVLVNHFKSKGFGNAQDSNERRRRQAVRVKEIYNALRQNHELVAVLGDLNDTPDSAPLAPMMTETDMKDVSEHANFVSDGRPGTYKNGTAGNKIDYVLLSPALFAKVTSGGIFRKGVWGGTNGTLFPHYPEITKEAEAASDHAAIWAEIAI
jgi:endonuclease/exonuclease/phosphatase family metal-dependent hydrolase